MINQGGRAVVGYPLTVESKSSGGRESRELYSTFDHHSNFEYTRKEYRHFIIMNGTDTKEHSPSFMEQSTKKCLCSDSETCSGLTTAFAFLDDPRKGFVRIPSYQKRKGPNLTREAYLRYLLPHHPIYEDTPTDYIAAHHFPPAIVLRYEHEQVTVPRTMTREEATELGIELNEVNAVFDGESCRAFIVVPDYPLAKVMADVVSILGSKTRKRIKSCLCDDKDSYCKGLTVAFTLLDDPRKGFVRLPKYHKRSDDNKIRQAYLRHLLPDHKLTKDTPTKYIAAHHFNPSIVLAQHELNGCEGGKKEIVPRTMSREEAMLFGQSINADDSIMDKTGRRVCIVVPNYPIEWTKADLDLILNQISRETSEKSSEEVPFGDDESWISVSTIESLSYSTDSS
jgi:hypothetical protein